jgi:plastocyanin
MLQRQHLTTRRSFIATVGFGGVGLYGAWAAYGAAPLPFVGSSDKAISAASREPVPMQGHGGHGAPGKMTPEEFVRNHGEFVARFKLPDGSIAPRAVPQPLVASPVPDASPQMPAGDHDLHAMPKTQATRGESHAAAGHDQPDTRGRSVSDQASHGASLVDSEATAPIDIYLLAFRFGFDPDELRLEAGKPYRFRMMASDITHGASLQLGGGSRIIRLRPNVVTEQTITFNRPGSVLVYCTVFCGPAHDAMKSRILVA